jgi:hypothetical protein
VKKKRGKTKKNLRETPCQMCVFINISLSSSPFIFSKANDIRKEAHKKVKLMENQCFPLRNQKNSIFSCVEIHIKDSQLEKIWIFHTVFGYIRTISALEI